VSAADLLTGRCTGCGADVTRDLAGVGGWMRARLAAMPFVCERCIAAAEQRERDSEQFRARAAAERRRHARRQHSGVPAELLDLRWSDLETTGREDAITAAKRWADGNLPGLVLTGPVGVGKTRIAAAAANAMLEHRALRWTSAPLVFARLGSGLGTDRREDAIDVLIGAHPLVLDDLDKTRPTEYAAEHVFAAIDTRLTEGIPLLVTTNLGSAEIAQKFPPPYGEAIASRLTRSGITGCRLEGRDRRHDRATDHHGETVR
jgi:DNA replication protein DnaC